MKNIAKFLGMPAVVTAIVPTAVSISSCGNKTEESATNYLDITNFDDVKIIDPISGDTAKWDMTVSGDTEEARIKDAYKQLATKYKQLIDKNSNYFKQDLIHYIWKAMRAIKNSITAFQGTFYFDISNLEIVCDTENTHHFRTSFVVNYDSALTYNDYYYAPYSGYQTQVNMNGKFIIKNLYVDVHFQKYEDSVASKPTFEFYADPTLSTNPTTAKSSGKGKVTYYNLSGTQVTLERTNEVYDYNTEITEEVIEKCYYKDPIFCLAIYWYKIVSASYSMESYSLKNVTSKITK